MVKFRSGWFMLSLGACTVHWRESLASLVESSVVCGLQGRSSGGCTVKNSLHSSSCPFGAARSIEEIPA